MRMVCTFTSTTSCVSTFASFSASFPTLPSLPKSLVLAPCPPLVHAFITNRTPPPPDSILQVVCVARTPERRRPSNNIVDALMRRELTVVRSSHLTEIVDALPEERLRQAMDRMALDAKPDIPGEERPFDSSQTF